MRRIVLAIKNCKTQNFNITGAEKYELCYSIVADVVNSMCFVYAGVYLLNTLYVLKTAY